MAGLPEGMDLLDLLRDAGLVADDHYQRAIHEAQRSGDRMEEVLIRIRAIDETGLLGVLAKRYKTQYVSTDKLARATPDARTLEAIPRHLVESLKVFPLHYRRRTQTLSCASFDLETRNVGKQLQVATGIREVKVFVARPLAVRAMIARHYDQDPKPLQQLLQLRRSEPAPGLDVNKDLADFAAGYGVGTAGGLDPLAPPTGVLAAPKLDQGLVIEDDGLMDDIAALAAQPRVRQRSQPPPGRALPPARRKTRERPSGPTIPPPAEGTETVALAQHLASYRVFVALLEREREGLRNHSAEVADLCERFATRLGLRGQERLGLLLAAWIHDIGKTSANYHLTALNVAKYDGHRRQAAKSAETPARLFEAANLPPEAKEVLAGMYERWDGQGFPQALRESDIPLGARILAVAETYLDLVAHEKNPYRRRLTPAEGVDVVRKLAGSLFDPSMAAILQQLVAGDLERRLLSDRRAVLIVDPATEETTILDLRFGAAGYTVGVVRSAGEALEVLGVGEGGSAGRSYDAILLEADLPDAPGFQLLKKMRARGVETPVLFHTQRGDKDSVDLGFALGAVDYLVKPTSADVVVAKVRQATTARPASRGVSGALSEMSLPDVVQVLSNGRKSGRLVLRAGGQSGEVWFKDGAIWDASFGGKTRENAFYAMLALTDGDFELDPSQSPSTRRIEASTESLLLEGMRRLDEAER
ncbi:MAG: HD domain-containing phosphohydrolase [Myxococcota bacterium]